MFYAKFIAVDNQPDISYLVKFLQKNFFYKYILHIFAKNINR